MGIFTRKPPRRRLPDDIVEMMVRFGRQEIDVLASRDEAAEVFRTTQAPLIDLAKEDPEAFVRALADVCVPAGGWAVYGADRTIVNLVGTDVPGSDWLRVLDASIEFQRANFVPPMRVPRYAWDRFLEVGGSSNTWIELRDPPGRDVAVLTPLDDGEIRRLVILTAAIDSNAILLRREGDHLLALVDSRWSDDDPTRSQSEWKRGTDQYSLYLEIARETQVWFWADPEIDPFFPAPRARI